MMAPLRVDAQVAIWGVLGLLISFYNLQQVLLFGDRLGLSLERIYVFCLLAVMLKLNKVK